MTSIKFNSANENLAKVFQAGMIGMAVKFGASAEQAEQSVSETILAEHSDWLDVAWLGEYKIAQLQTRFDASPARQEIIGLLANVSTLGESVKRTKKEAADIENLAKVDYTAPTETLSVESARALMGALAVAISASVLRVAPDKAEKVAESDSLASKYTNSNLLYSEALKSAGFEGCAIDTDGKISYVKTAAPEKKAASPRKAGGKHERTLVNDKTGESTTFASAIKLTQHCKANGILPNLSEREENVWIDAGKLSRLLAAAGYSVK